MLSVPARILSSRLLESINGIDNRHNSSIGPEQPDNNQRVNGVSRMSQAYRAHGNFGTESDGCKAKPQSPLRAG